LRHGAGLVDGGEHPGQVGAGAEGAAGAPDHEDAGLQIIGPAHGRFEALHHGGADGVAGLGPVDGGPQHRPVLQQNDVADAVAAHGYLRHSSSGSVEKIPTVKNCTEPPAPAPRAVWTPSTWWAPHRPRTCCAASATRAMALMPI